MSSVVRLLLGVVAVACMSGCASSRYEWNDYDTRLYQYYKAPTERENFAEALREAILEGEPSGRVAPGIYAEYGYLMYEMGNSQAAIMYYQKEADRWPESRFFMNKMIIVARNRIKKEPAKPTPAEISPPAANTSETVNPASNGTKESVK